MGATLGDNFDLQTFDLHQWMTSAFPRVAPELRRWLHLRLRCAVCRAVAHPVGFPYQLSLRDATIERFLNEVPMKSVPVPFGRSSILVLVLTFSLLHSQDASALDLSRIWPIAGSGAVVKENRTVERFRALKLDTGARIVLRQGERFSVEVQAEGNVAPLIETYVEDGTLVIADSRHYKSSSAEVVVTARRISSIATTGTVSVLAEDLNSPSLRLSMGGSSAVILRSVSINKLHASLGGSSVLKVSGVADDFVTELGGSSTIEASELAASAVSVDGGGSAQAVVWAKEALRLSLGGSCGVSYYGNVSPVLATSGAATVKSLGDASARHQ
jgi:hypothetical protein